MSEVVGGIGTKSVVFSKEGERNCMGVEELSGCGRECSKFLARVELVSHDGMTDGSEMDPYLVHAPGSGANCNY